MNEIGPPMLYIIAGCNGAGKTTASMSVLPEVLDCYEFVNADEIAKGLSPFRPEEMAIPAGKLMLQRYRSVAFGEEDLCNRDYFGYAKLSHIGGESEGGRV